MKTKTHHNSEEPYEYKVKNAEFYSLDFYVDPRVLIPRNETELLVEKALIFLKNNKRNLTCIDVGTGSGCIPISIRKNQTSNNIEQYYSIDISKKAIEVTKINIKKHKLEKDITTLNGSLLEPVIPFLENTDLIITANLPYIKNNDYENMDMAVREHEPDSALYGGKDTGFELYEELIYECMSLKKKKSISHIQLFIEIGFDQYEVSKNFLEKHGLKYQFYKDYNDIQRCIEIEL